MIYGVIPVGGKGTRLGLPFSKEMLPQARFSEYRPIMSHTVEKMYLAGAKKIVCVHGTQYKSDVVNYFTSYDDLEFIHLQDDGNGFRDTLRVFDYKVRPNTGDIIMFGLPDSVHQGNIYKALINTYGSNNKIVIGLFSTDNTSKVDRCIIGTKNFTVKSQKTCNNTDKFWGAFTVTVGINTPYLDLFVRKQSYTNEIGEIFNVIPSDQKILTHESINNEVCKYLDLGTWENVNEYYKRSHEFNRSI
jgi:choline kinase